MYCANCGASLGSLLSHSPQHISSEGGPYLEDEILNKIRGLFLPVTGKKLLVGGVIVILLLFSAGIVGGLLNNGGGSASTATPTTMVTVAPTSTPSVAAPLAAPSSTPSAETPTVAPTATPAPTEVPTLSSFHGLLVEHPASVSGDDLSKKINDEESFLKTLDTPVHRATIDGRDVYIGKLLSDSGQKLTYYMFPLGSFSEARAAQSAYVKQFEAIGFTKLTDDTSMSKEESVIQLQAPSGSGTLYIDALGFQADLARPAMDIYYALSSENSAA